MWLADWKDSTGQQRDDVWSQQYKRWIWKLKYQNWMIGVMDVLVLRCVFILELTVFVIIS